MSLLSKNSCGSRLAKKSELKIDISSKPFRLALPMTALSERATSTFSLPTPRIAWDCVKFSQSPSRDRARATSTTDSPSTPSEPRMDVCTSFRGALASCSACSELRGSLS